MRTSYVVFLLLSTGANGLVIHDPQGAPSFILLTTMTTKQSRFFLSSHNNSDKSKDESETVDAACLKKRSGETLIMKEEEDHDVSEGTAVSVESFSRTDEVRFRGTIKQDEVTVSSQKQSEKIWSSSPSQANSEPDALFKGTNMKDSRILIIESRDVGGHTKSEDFKDGKTLEVNKENESNPFAQFAFGATEGSDSTTKRVRSRNWIEPDKKKANTKKSEKKQECIPMSELSPEERERVLSKWHGLSNASSGLEDRRFQVMVASRLHARCQETVVRKCMKVLEQAGVLTCISMAQVDPEVLALSLASLQYYNTKAKHLVQASRELLEHFDGQVPESKDDLLKVTGIGPVMADLLSNINTRESFRR